MGKLKEDNLHPDLLEKIEQVGSSSELSKALGLPTDEETSPSAFGRINKNSKTLDSLTTSSDELLEIEANGRSTVSSALTNRGIQTDSDADYDTIVQNIGQIEIDPGTAGDAIASNVLSGKTFSNESDLGLTGTMANNGAVSRTLSTDMSYYTIPAGYHNGSGRVSASISNLIASNIKKGVTVGGVIGTYVSGPKFKEWTTPGNYTFTIPDGVTMIYIDYIGGGGGGGGGGNCLGPTFHGNPGSNGTSTTIHSGSTLIVTGKAGEGGQGGGGSAVKPSDKRGRGGWYEGIGGAYFRGGDGGIYSSFHLGGTLANNYNRAPGGTGVDSNVSPSSNGANGSGGHDYGAGGGGGGAVYDVNKDAIGGGGGGSSTGSRNYPKTVTPGEVLTIVVGRGGAGGSGVANTTLGTRSGNGSAGRNGYVKISWS